MSTYADYITECLRKIGVCSETETASAEQGADGLRTFNDLMGSLAGDGIDLGFVPQTSTTATLLIPWEDRQSVKYLLCVKLCTDYQRSVSGEIAKGATDGYNTLLRKAVLADALESQSTLPLGRARRTFNIIRGY